ncbi:hypothetical protein KUCAC02_020810 [Chaenocephalus aceratus]|uniref:Uncharacterized protein n=1 Tax=Chaenocephalus aceratus TaxID=36190 RepID=A0ACB9XFR7_CHAAC|nr:hypothetical protein KUCAC02_020810 [Chaenocephalus aceratus]
MHDSVLHGTHQRRKHKLHAIVFDLSECSEVVTQSGIKPQTLSLHTLGSPCQANIKSYFLCMTESNQRVKILRNQDGAPRSFTEGDPVFIPTPECSPEEPERSSSRTLLRVPAPLTGRDHGPGHFDELPAFGGAERPDAAPHTRRSRKVVDYFWIPTDQE